VSYELDLYVVLPLHATTETPRAWCGTLTVTETEHILRWYDGETERTQTFPCTHDPGHVFTYLYRYLMQ
jgi:hypothetical protein